MSVETRTDEELLGLVCDGDHEAMAALVERYQKDIFRFCLHYLKNRDRARDMAQETFVRVYVARDRFDTARKFMPWILRIARNLCLNEIKRKKPVQMDALEEYASEARVENGAVLQNAPDSPYTIAADAERRQALMDVLDTLDDDSRELLVLRFFEKMQAREIGDIVGMSEGAVRTRLHRTLKSLNKRFGDLQRDL